MLPNLPSLTRLYGPAVRCKLNLLSGSDWSCSSVSGPLVERMLLAIMDIRAHPISFSDRPSKANRVTRSRMRRRDRSPISSNPTRRPRRVTPYDQRPKEQLKPSLRSHRRSLARPGERRWRRGMAAIIPLVNQSELISSRSGANAWFVCSMLRKHTPCDAGELVGESSGQHIVVQPLGCCREPRPKAVLHPLARPY